MLTYRFAIYINLVCINSNFDTKCKPQCMFSPWVTTYVSLAAHLSEVLGYLLHSQQTLQASQFHLQSAGRAGATQPRRECTFHRSVGTRKAGRRALSQETSHTRSCHTHWGGEGDLQGHRRKAALGNMLTPSWEPGEVAKGLWAAGQGRPSVTEISIWYSVLEQSLSSAALCSSVLHVYKWENSFSVL